MFNTDHHSIMLNVNHHSGHVICFEAYLISGPSAGFLSLLKILTWLYITKRVYVNKFLLHNMMCILKRRDSVNWRSKIMQAMSPARGIGVQI